MTTCETCGNPVKVRQQTKANRFCSPGCYHQSMRDKRKKPSVRWRMKKAPGHPLAPPSGTVSISRINLYEKIGPGPHPCHWCGVKLEWRAGAGPVAGSIVADHLSHDATDDSPENLVPSCNVCNAHRTRRGNRKSVRDDELYVEVGGARTRAVQQFCGHCGQPFLAIPALVRAGKARYCSRSCARKHGWVLRKTGQG